MYIAGIDGGGTHTRLELRDGNNRFLRRETFGAFNLNSIGEAAFRSLLRQVFAACGSMAGCAGICFGAAGVSNSAVKDILAQELKAAGFSGPWKLCGDQEIALRGAMDGPGVAVIAGTGSICFGKNQDGQTARSGGYGHLIDDGGSGYALGRDVLHAAVCAVDGRDEDPAILEAVYARLGVREPGGIALELAEAGNPRAQAILDQGARDLYGLAATVQRCLGLDGQPIALLGGLLSGDNVYRRRVAEKLSALGEVIFPAHDALWGAAQMAWELR